MLNRVLRTALLSAAACGLALAAHAQTPAPQSTPQTTPPAAQAPTAPAAQAPATQAPANPVVARVNGEEIRLAEVMRMVGQLPPQVQQMPMEMIYPAILDQVVNQKLVSGAGYKENLDKSDAVKEEVKRAEERFVQRAYIQREVEKRITDEALQEAYKEFVAQNPPQEEVKASHILVENEADAKQVIEQLGKGGDFAQLSKEKSKDPGSAAQGGDLGYFTKDTMVEPFAVAAFAMKKGDVSKEPVKTQFGWHVIKVEDKRTAPAPTLEEVKPQLEQQLSKEIVTALVDELRTTAKVETFQMDGSPVPKEEPAPAKPAGAAPAAAPAAPAPAEPKKQ